MLGLMQDRPLLISQLIEHAALNHGDTEIVSRSVEGPIHRHTYRDDGSFTAWMYHLARRCAADYFRKHNAAPAATDPADLQEYADARPNAGDEAGVSDDHAFLHRALNRLDRDDRRN